LIATLAGRPKSRYILGMIHSATLVAAMLASASEEEVNIAAWIEADSLVVGQEYEFMLGL